MIAEVFDLAFPDQRAGQKPMQEKEYRQELIGIVERWSAGFSTVIRIGKPARCCKHSVLHCAVSNFQGCIICHCLYMDLFFLKYIYEYDSRDRSTSSETSKAQQNWSLPKRINPFPSGAQRKSFVSKISRDKIRGLKNGPKCTTYSLVHLCIQPSLLLRQILPAIHRSICIHFESHNKGINYLCGLGSNELGGPVESVEELSSALEDSSLQSGESRREIQRWEHFLW